MKKRTADKFWFPWWPDKWIFGSIRIECTPAERGIWVDLLSLASKDDGHIRANEETPYPLDQLAGMLRIPQDEFKRAVNKFTRNKKLTRTKTGTLYVTKWDKYQFSDRHKRRLEGEMSEKTDTMAEHEDAIVNNKKENKKKLNKKKKHNNKKGKEKDIVTTFEEVDTFLATLLIDLMRENLPSSHIVKRYEKSETIQADWIRQCRLMRQREGRTAIEIETLIRWSQKDDFWRSNILSIAKLRKQFDRLLLQAKKTNYAGIREWLREVENEQQGL